MLSLSVYEPIAIQILLGGAVPQFGRGVELGGRVWCRVKVLRMRYNLFAGSDTFCVGGRSPIWELVELGGRVWYPVKLLHIRYNLFAGTEMLSLSVYEPIAIQILLGGTVPQFGGGDRARDRVWHPAKVLRIR